MAKKKVKRPCATATIGGKRKYFYAETYKEAENKRDLYLYELANPIIKMEQIVDEWAELHEPEVAYKTWSGYKAHVTAIKSTFGETGIKELSHLDISRMLNGMAKKKYANKTVRTRLNILKMIMEYAILNRYIEENPCQFVKIPKGLSKSKRELPEQSEIDKVKNGLTCHFGLFAYFLLYTGIIC